MKRHRCFAHSHSHPARVRIWAGDSRPDAVKHLIREVRNSGHPLALKHETGTVGRASVDRRIII